MQIYLNGEEQGLVGGATTIFDDQESPLVKVLPKTGRVLLFEHEILHEGSPVDHGTKYAIRSDVMYSNSPPSDAKVEAGKLYASANELELQGKYDEAVSLYKRVYRLDPSFGK